ncbi:MAG: FAD-dependent oxidoreductase, partial [Bacteroidota bacterium]
MKYDLIVIGSGPGGYTAAVRAAQYKLKVAVVEKEELGGVCLNWGCIPTKSLIKSAQVFNYINHASDYGINIRGEAQVDFNSVIKRSRTISEKVSKGISYLFKKN